MKAFAFGLYQIKRPGGHITFYIGMKFYQYLKYTGQALLELLKATLARWLEHNMMLHAAGLAFYTIFSLAPLLVIVVAVAGAFLGEQAASGQLSLYMGELLGPELAESVENIVSAVAQGRSGLIPTLTSTFILVFAATTVLTQLKESLNIIWEVDPNLKQPIKMFFINRFLALILILIFAITLAFTIVISAVFASVGPYVNELIPGGIGWYSVLNTSLFFVVTTCLFSIVYKMLPDIRISWSDVMVGALVTALLFFLGQKMVTYYLNNAATASMYGAAGSFVIFLIWVYYNVMVIFFGAEFTQVYTERYGSGIKMGRYINQKNTPADATPPEKSEDDGSTAIR